MVKWIYPGASKAASGCCQSPVDGGWQPTARHADFLVSGLAAEKIRARKWYNQRPHRTSSKSRSGRHETGLPIHRLMSDSCQPVPLVLILS
jgi:hypothetical protein